MRLLKQLFFIALAGAISGCYLNSSIIDKLSSTDISSPGVESPAPTDPSAPTSPVVVTPGPVATLSGASFLKVNHDYIFDITLNATHSSDITVTYETQNITALSPMNYLAQSGSIVIPAGNTSAQISIRTTDKFDSVGTYKDFKLKLLSTSAGTLDQAEKTLSVGMTPITNIVNIYQTTAASGSRCVQTNTNQLKCWGSYSASSPEPFTVPGTNYAKFALGGGFSCILTSSGGVKCTGSNFYGQLGDGTNNPSDTALVDAIGLTSGVSDVTAGFNHACALLTNGTVSCWGGNSSGQLGRNSTTSSSTPSVISGLTGVTKVVASGNYTCAIASGGLKCWGQNTERQVGDNTAVNKLVPTNVTGLTSGVLDVYLGLNHTCAKVTGNTAKCWGQNNAGQIGDGSTTNRATPVDVTSLTNVSSIAVGNQFTCAILGTGSVQCWGLNVSGQLGDGTVVNRSTYVAVAGLPTTATKLALGSYSSCAVLTSGAVYCWGSHGGSYAELGDGQDDWASKYPRKVTTLGSNIMYAARARWHTCVVLSTGALKCWGKNTSGQLGDNTMTDRAEPVAVSGLSSGVLKVAMGIQSSCALLTGGAVQCWGNGYTQGDGTFVGKMVPTAVSGLSSGVNDIQVGKNHACALLSSGGVKCWGYNIRGQVGDGTNTNRSSPVDVQGLTAGVASIAIGSETTCARLTNGTVKCWGQNEGGQLGNGNTTDSNTPLLIPTITTASKVTVSEHSACALLSSGAVKCWGANWAGELGDDTYNDSATPVDVIGMQSGVVDISAGGEDYSDYVCALLNTGVMKCWGDNTYRQIVGSPSATGYSIPTAMVGLSGITSMVKGYSANNCIINSSSELICWGLNDYNQSRGVLSIAPQPVLIGNEDL